MVVNNDRRSIQTIPRLLDVTNGPGNHHEIRSSNIDCDLCNFALEKNKLASLKDVIAQNFFLHTY